MRTLGMDEAELRRLIADRPNPSFGPHITLPYGEIILTETLVISDRAEFKMVGKGMESTRFRYSGDPSQPAIVLEHCLRSYVGGFHIVGECDSAISIRTRRDAPSWPISGSNTVEAVGIWSGPRVGVFIDSRERDANNEFHKLIGCDIRGTEYGVRINATQAHRLQFTDCHIGYSKIGVFSERGAYWVWRDGQCTNNELDFLSNDFHQQVVIERHRSEGSRRLYVCRNGTIGPSTLRDITWDGHPAEEPVILVHGWGPFMLENVSIMGDGPIRIQSGAEVTHANGVSITYQGYDDTVQRPIIANRVTGTAVTERIIQRGSWRHRTVPLSYNLEGVTPISDGQWPFELGSNNQRSFTLACDITLPDYQFNWAVVEAAGITYRLYGSAEVSEMRMQLVPRRGGEQFADYVYGKYEPGKTYPFVLAYDRDTQHVSAMMGSTRIGGTPWDRIAGGRTRGRLEVDDTLSLPEGASNVRMWDRALSLGEMQRLVK